MNVFQSLFFLTISVCLIWISGGNSYIPHKLRSAGITDSSSQTFYPRNAPPVSSTTRSPCAKMHRYCGSTHKWFCVGAEVDVGRNRGLELAIEQKAGYMVSISLYF